MKIIPLTRGLHAMVDDEDFVKFGIFKWYAQRGRNGKFYAARGKLKSEGNGLVWLHREIIGTALGKLSDHIDGNTLDDRKINLRSCTTSENNWNRTRLNNNNTSGFRGVSWRKSSSKWRAYITINGKRSYLGNFDSIKEAARVHHKASINLYGEFSPKICASKIPFEIP